MSHADMTTSKAVSQKQLGLQATLFTRRAYGGFDFFDNADFADDAEDLVTFGLMKTGDATTTS